jgi:phospholipid/cholesterol/gamma-HCH transport system substrate-binding protein
MKFSIRFADQIVGTLVVVALAILVVVIFMIGKTQRWFKQDLQYYTYVESATGLSKNMPITYKGFNIGYVKEFALADDIEKNKKDVVRVDFIILDEQTERIKDGSLVEFKASPVPGLLPSSFVLHPGKGENIIPSIPLRNVIVLVSDTDRKSVV